MLAVRGLVRAFGNFNAVDGVDLTVDAGTITGIIGPNGAGKSTLFNLIAGGLRPTAGDILFEGRSISGLAPNRIFERGLARTFQIPRPFPRMTVLENVMLAPIGQTGERFWSNWLAAARVASEERAIRERAAEVLDFCGLGGKSGELAGTLSGGFLVGLAENLSVLVVSAGYKSAMPFLLLLLVLFFRPQGLFGQKS